MTKIQDFIKGIAKVILKEELDSYTNVMLKNELRIAELVKINNELGFQIDRLEGNTELSNYYNNKYPKQKINYKRTDTTGTIKIDVRCFIQKNNYNYPTFTGSDDEIALESLKYVIKNVKYQSDTISNNLSEYWQFPYQTLNAKTGDCIAEDEEIITKEGIKKAKDINVGDFVLSYDLTKKEYVYKPIVKKWDKGKLQIKRVHFRNGQHIDVTNNHHMAVRTNRYGDSIYEKKDLKDIDLTKWWKRRVPIAKKIPYNLSSPLFHKDLYVVLGHYLAEGFTDRKSRVDSSGYELIEYIIPLLEKHNIPFTEYKNNSGVPCIRFLKSEFKEYLKIQKKNSFDIHLSEEIINLPEDYLEALLYGMWLGDGTKKQYPDKRGYKNNKEWTYSTSSEKLAEDIQLIGLHLGRTFHIWKQEHHKGIGNKPIWRINYNPESYFLKNHGYDGLGEVSISYVEDLNKIQCYDWEVEGTHTFFFKNGIMTFQCEDGSLLLASIMLYNKIPSWKIRINCGFVINPYTNNKEGHAYVTYYCEETNTWTTLDWCYLPDKTEINKRVSYKDNQIYESCWFSFNDLYSWGNDADIRLAEKEFLNN